MPSPACIGATVISFPSAYASSADEYVSKVLPHYEPLTFPGRRTLRKIQKPRKNQNFRSSSFYIHRFFNHFSDHFSVQDEHLLKLKELQKKYNTRMHIHLHETKKEVEDHLQQHNVRPLERMKKLGLCDDHLLAVHMTQLEDDEISYLSQTGFCWNLDNFKRCKYCTLS
jgi:5-methylthioadenosine/S-adenosylhomocysteine deaminase